MKNENLNLMAPARTLVQKALASSQNFGLDSAEIHVGVNRGFSVNVRIGNLESIEHHFTQSVSIKVYLNQRVGVATTSELTQESFLTTLEKAYQIAKYTSQDPCAGLPEKKFLAFDYPDLDLYHPWDISVPEAIQLALDAEAEGLAYSDLITNSDGVGLSSYQHHALHANTSGFFAQYSSTLHSLSCSLLASQNGEMQRDDDYTVARDASDLTDFKAVTRHAAQGALKRLNPRSLPSCQVPVLFSARMAKGLLKSFVSAIQGSNLYRKSSFLLDHLGKPVFPDFVEIDQRPHLPKEMGSAPFDSDGVKTAPCFFVKEGILENYLLGNYSAKRLNMLTNGNAGGPFNLFIRSGEKDLQGLLKEMGKGLFVTDLIGHGINLINGDYSRGVFGFWVEGGEIQYPVSGITIAGNLKDMFMNIIAIGKDVDARGNIKTGSILIDGMTIAGQ